jgi:hypothetical protein
MGKCIPGWNGLIFCLHFKLCDCYSCAMGRSEPQDIYILLGWTTDPANMAGTIAVFQERTAWGNRSGRTLSLLFPMINDRERLKPPWSIRPPSQSSTFASCLCRWWEGLEFLGNACGCCEGWSFEEMGKEFALIVIRQMFGGIVVQLYLRLFR